MALFRSVFTISFYTALSRILGFVRDVLIARYLGVTVLSDAFFAAFKLPNFFRRVFAEGAFNSAFVPIFVEKVQDTKDSQDEQFFVRNIFSLLFYALLLFIIIFQIFMPILMKGLFPGFFNEPIKAELLIELSRITIFYLLFISLVSLCSGILNSVGKFAIPASAPIILNASLVTSVFLFRSFSPTYAHALSWGVFAAGILQFLWLFIFTAKAGYLLYPRLPKFNTDLKKFFNRLIPGVIGANLLQINLLVNSIFASLIAGGVSYLYYADRINQLPLALIGIAIGIALLPDLSKKIKARKHNSAIRMQNMALEVGLILVIPATLALTIIANPIISTLFERGKFTPHETYHVAKALTFYSLGLPAYVLIKVIEPAFFARSDTKTPMRIAFICMISNVILNFFFFILEMSYVGIIISSVLSSYLNLILLLTVLIRRKHFKFEKKFIKKLILILIPSVIMAFSLVFMRDLFHNNHKLNNAIELSIMVLTGILIYGVSSYFSGSLNILSKSRLLKKK
ncbi:MAG: murein biosynthesis integral membrane protein MurJ [Rickettsiales bacterium]|nr:murein biosynthesis integral membrane protein MurJ [Rickettsiales bacterium]